MPPNVARQFIPQNRAITRGLPSSFQQLERPRPGLATNVARGLFAPANLARGIGREAVHNPFNFILDLIPGLGDVKAGQEAVTGRNIVTGESLGPLERVLSGLAVLPFVPGTIKQLGKRSTPFKKSIIKTPVFHGTKQDFIEFDPKFSGLTTGMSSAKKGIFFTSNPDVAGRFANLGIDRQISEKLTELSKQRNLKNIELQKARGDKNISDKDFGDLQDEVVALDKEINKGMKNLSSSFGGQSIRPVFLDIKDPLIVEAKAKDVSSVGISRQINKAKREGKDGVIIKNLRDDPASIPSQRVESDIFIVFEPEQIKSIFDIQAE